MLLDFFWIVLRALDSGFFFGGGGGVKKEKCCPHLFRRNFGGHSTLEIFLNKGKMLSKCLPQNILQALDSVFFLSAFFPGIAVGIRLWRFFFVSKGKMLSKCLPQKMLQALDRFSPRNSCGHSILEICYS